jgi:hypothetical protein
LPDVAAYPDQFSLMVGMEELPGAAALIMGPPGSGTLPVVAALATPENAVVAAAHMRAAAVKAVAHKRLVSIASPLLSGESTKLAPLYRRRHARAGDLFTPRWEASPRVARVALLVPPLATVLLRVLPLLLERVGVTVVHVLSGVVCLV